MTLILDYSFARPDPAAIKAAGYSGVMRYLSVDNAQTHGKILTTQERDALFAQGLSIGLVWEFTAGRATSGVLAGSEDQQAAESMANALGYPHNLPIFYAVDQGVAPGIVLPYFQGVAQGAIRPVGVYGSLTVTEGVLNAGTATLAWQTCGWSGLAVSPRASLYQRLHPTVPNPIAGADENVLIHSFPLWGGVTPGPVVVNHPPAPSSIPPVFRVPPVVVPDLKLGSTGAAVRALQLGMDHVFPAYSHLTVDGVYGPATFAVVVEFQKRSNLTPDGVVGPNTRAALRRNGVVV